MALIWTADRIKSLAHDDHTWERARRLGHAPVWRFPSGNEQLIWGECRGAGGIYYQTAVDISLPAFACNCPVKRMPCKHALALLLLLLNYGDAFRVTEEAPDWVLRWQHSRKRSQPARSDSPAQAVSRAKNRDKRLEGMTMGVEALRQWLHDVVQQGMAEFDAGQAAQWHQLAARMVDAKLGGVARKLRLMGQFAPQINRHEQQLDTLAELYLIVKGFDHFEALDPALQADLLTVAGVAQRRETLADAPGIQDHWLIAGVETGTEEQLQYRRTWLLGRHTGNKALLLDFAWGGNAFEHYWATGMRVRGTLTYYPSAYPQRAVLADYAELTHDYWTPACWHQLSEAATAYAEALAANPWLQYIPVMLSSVVPCYHLDQVLLADEHGKAVPLDLRPEAALSLLAMSAGEKINIFGVWSGAYFRPLSLEIGTDFISI